MIANQLRRMALLAGFALLLAACGGGSKDGGDVVGSDPDASTVLSVELELRGVPVGWVLMAMGFAQVLLPLLFPKT